MIQMPAQNYQGPTDTALRSSNISGYSQVSRIGEQVINAFVDSYEYGALPESISVAELNGEGYMNDASPPDLTMLSGNAATNTDKHLVEHKPHFHEWATAYVGMIAISRRMRTNFRNHMAAESAAPVVVCAAGKGPLDEVDFQFAGVVRSNSVRTMDDGVGPTVDEYFTLTTSGMMTIHNNSGSVIHSGDMIAWTFECPEDLDNKTRLPSRNAPRRVGIRVADYHDENVIGRSLGFAKPGALFDVIVSLV